MLILAFETSCDETSVALVRDGQVLANVVSSQVKLHEEYGGVVPELATREHLKNLMPVAREALRVAGVTADQLDAVAATRGPRLPPALANAQEPKRYRSELITTLLPYRHEV